MAWDSPFSTQIGLHFWLSATPQVSPYDLWPIVGLCRPARCRIMRMSAQADTGREALKKAIFIGRYPVIKVL